MGLPTFPQVCALVRNDMQKVVVWLRVQRRFSGSTPAVPWFYADTRQVSACHCEERSDVAIRISCGSTQQNATISGEYVEAADLP